MEISFIIVNWNAKKLMMQCISSIINAKLPFSYEIIVVDNASSDGSQQTIAQEYPNVKLIQNPINCGFAKANNIGIQNASGDYLCLVNSDVILLPGSMEKMICLLNDKPQIGMLGPQVIGKNGNVQRSCMGYPTLINLLARAFALDKLFPKSKLLGGHLMTFWKHDTIRRVDVINGCFWVIRKNALNVVGLLDERFFMYGEDIDWCRRFWNKQWEILFYPEAQIIHLGGGSSAKAPIRFAVEQSKADLMYWKKYNKKISYVAYCAIQVCHHLIRLVGYSICMVIMHKNIESSIFKIRRSYCILYNMVTYHI